MFKTSFYFLTVLFINLTISAYSQNKPAAQYPSLLWEITGNGLVKPSYLFGTMHVSSKMVFHLSDSFYYAIKHADAVALELNPELWQGQMVHMNKEKQNYLNFTESPEGDYLSENSFRISKYDDFIKTAMSSEPAMVNSLLYRSYKAREDFEEDTFLDLYIFQTGKKLGKRSTAVEDYVETEKIVMEAYTDMAREKKKKLVDPDNESKYDIEQKLQDAYRNGDLDLMDSLDRMLDRSAAFMEKFLYKRNEIQANSIDTILKKSSLFAGVGAAHLPGQRGVIELLRQKGYKLRPVFMNDRDARQKEAVDKIKVPVIFSTQNSEDGFYRVTMPGPLYKLTDDYGKLDRRQYADMSNGAYYLVTRIKTHAAFLGQNEKEVLKNVDRFFYENIPGKIISKKLINRNGYAGYDISNRTRRGDLQRCNIFVTAFEILLFKMSGKENYVQGKEAEIFFSSIQLKARVNSPVLFEPKQGGFSVKLPQAPVEYLNTFSAEGVDRWEYEAVDKTNGDAYLILKKSIYNFKFIQEDSFDLGLIEESFRNPDFFEKQLSRSQSSFNGYPCLDVQELMKDGSVIQAKYIIRGPHYYAVAAKFKTRGSGVSEFFNSFHFTTFKYNIASAYVDTFMHFSVNTPVVPQMNDALREQIEKSAEEMANGNNYSGYTSYWPKSKNGLFKCDATGEMIAVSVQEYPKYYYVSDSAKFWINNINENYRKNDLLLYKIDSLVLHNGIKGYCFELRDTGSSRKITRLVMLKDNHSFSLVTLGDTISANSFFINSFFNSFIPDGKKLGRNLYVNRLDEYFTDLFSKDSTVQIRALQCISEIYYGEKGAPKILEAIERLNLSDKQYFETKSKLIAELGFIKDTTRPVIVNQLKRIYEQTADTSIFQNEIFKALARHKTKAALGLFKELILQDPPIFNDDFDYTGIFNSLEDSLLLAKNLFPELLQLTPVSDYKEKILSLLVILVDSSIIKATDYENYFSKIYFDARIELKRQQLKEEKIMENELLKGDDEKGELLYYNYDRDGQTNLDEYNVLLLPYYTKYKNVQLFFEQQLNSKEADVRLNVAVLLIRNDIPVADSVLLNLAADDQYRSKLFSRLETAKRLNKFPGKYANQLDIARSNMVADKKYDKIDSIVFLQKQTATFKNKKGVVYFFKYRVKKEGDWKIGISGLQPVNEDEASSDVRLTSMTEKKIKPDETLDDQLQRHLKRMLFSFHPSATNFYGDGDSNESLKRFSDYEN